MRNRIKWELLNASGTNDWDSEIGAIYQQKVGGKPIPIWTAYLKAPDGDERLVGNNHSSESSAKAAVKRAWDKNPPIGN
jgi:hypothetical protein